MKPKILFTLLSILIVSSVATQTHAVCDYGPDTCLPGFVWREAFSNDHVCVTGATRARTKADNNLANQRRSPTGGPYGPDTCLAGFVWREASHTDRVCVTGSARTQTASDNTKASSRRDPQCTLTVPPPPPPQASTAILFGTGVSDITGPAAEVVMMGYANSDQVSGGISQRLYARAYVFANPGARRVVFVSAELGQLFGSIKQGVVRKLVARYGTLYDDRNVQLSATHTHAGPGGYSHHAIFNFTSFGYIKQNYDVIVDGITNAIVQAHDSLSQGTIGLSTGMLGNASVNRSLVAYNKNPDGAGKPSINHDIKLLRLDRPTGPAGAITWFSVHNTSLTRTNRFISSDHKGYAAYLFEKSRGTIQPFQSPGKFIAAFPNGDEGDQSPNIKHGFRGPGDPDEFLSMRIIGEREFNATNNLFSGSQTPVRGNVDFRHTFVNMPGLLVATGNLNGANKPNLCNGAYGFSFAAGAEDGPSGVPGFTEGMKFYQKNENDWYDLSNFFKGSLMPQHLKAAFNVTAQTFNDECQRPKPVLIPSTALGWAPDILPFQILRVGNIAIVGVPGEMTVQAGRRLRDHVLSSLRVLGINEIILTGLANDYSGYITTHEEYDEQHYEGASTLFGRLTLDAYLQIFGKLASEMVAGVPSASGPIPPDLSQQQITLQTPVLYDNTPVLQVFGQAILQPPTSVIQGGFVDVTFRAGHPKNNLMTGGTYYLIERQTQGGAWAAAVWDSMPEGRFGWRRDADILCKACSFADVHWDVPKDAIPGTYRIKHMGSWKHGTTGALARYEGITNTFIVRAAGSVTPCGGVGQRGCCVIERVDGILGKPCTGDLKEGGSCTGADCTCGGNNPNGSIKSSGMCLSPPAAPVVFPCGGDGQRACCTTERLGGILGVPCGPNLHEGGSCTGPDCMCGGDNTNRELKSIGMCIAATHCGGQGERACCTGERSGGLLGKPCATGLHEDGNCTGPNCTCGGDNPKGIYKSIGMCNAPTHCGDLGERACCVIERAGGVFGKACSGNLREAGSCRGAQCICGGNNPNGTEKSLGMCVR